MDKIDEEFFLRINNYLYLHPSEDPATSLVSSLRDLINYLSWSRSTFTTLGAKNKL